MRNAAAIVLALSLMAALVPAPAGAERYRRQFRWSGYTWQVRLARHEDPGRNTWWDAKANVRVQSDGSLRLAITHAGSVWRCVELASKRRLGYGRYRWVVGSPLDAMDPHAVLALFTDDSVHRSPYGEQIFEFATWADPSLLPGWAVSWSRRAKRDDSFALSPSPPYTIEVTWLARTVQLRMVDAAGTVLYDRTRVERSDGEFMLARMSYWLFRGPPAGGAPPAAIVLRSFAFTPAG